MLTQERDQAQLHRQQERLRSHSQLAQCGGSVGENHSEETYRGILAKGRSRAYTSKVWDEEPDHLPRVGGSSLT